jgi:hypothetical protein
LLQPEFLYHVEHGEAPVAGRTNVFALAAHELAARLSYHVWETLPDQALWEAARTGALKRPEVFAAQVGRLLADPRARRVTRQFFREWLQLDEIPRLDGSNSDALFKAFAGPDMPTSRLRDAVIEDALAFVEHHTWQRPGGVEDLLSSALVFPRAPELARLYGTATWTGGAPLSVATDERPGLFTRAAFLAAGGANSRPILRGAFFRTAVLCDEVPPPPNGDAPAPPALSDRLTTRQVVEALTEAPGTVCAACHSTLINPLGFAFEGYDALGRARAEQRLFTKTGQEVGRAPVDTATIPQVVPGDLRPSRGAVDLMRLVAASGKVQACLARQAFRFAHRRAEDLERDGCALERVRRGFDRNGALGTALKDVVMQPEFHERAF